MAQKTLTAPLALIKVNGIVIGKMKNIRCTENIRRGRVSGIGQLTPDELPALEWSGTLNCGFYAVEFAVGIMKSALIRNVNTLDEFVDTVLLQENGIQIDVTRKVKDTGPDPTTGIIVSKLEIFASVKGCFLTREGFDISEGQISGRDADFEYTTPILFPL
jgi:hypothetical protein